MSGDWLMGAGPGAIYELWLVNDHLVDHSESGQVLATVIDTGSAGHPFIAMLFKQLGEQLRDEDLATWRNTKDEKKFWKITGINTAVVLGCSQSVLLNGSVLSEILAITWPNANLMSP